jgi:curved DNA-binding protein CbpA
VSSASAGKFQDHYVVLGIEPNATNETITSAYTLLAAKYNPRNAETGDQEQFDAVNFAYETLLDPMQRKIFDGLRSGGEKEAEAKFSGLPFFSNLNKEGICRQTLLCLLYDRRRTNPISPGLAFRQVEAMIDTDLETLTLAIWYLKQRGLIVGDDKSRLLITVDGIDLLMKEMPSPESVLRLLKATAVAEAPVIVTA